jgi:hypothetical protein
MKAIISIALFGCLLSGCATNPFSQFYTSYTNQIPHTVQQRFTPASANPKLFSTTPQKHLEDGRQLEEQNYVCIGMAGFRGGNPTQTQLVQQAKKVGADLVLWASEYSHTEQGVMPLMSYQPGQSYTTQTYGTATANAYGSGGSAYGYGTYSGTSTTTTPGTYNTQFMPYQRAVYEHGASFWRRTKPGVFGVGVNPIPPQMRSSLQRNTGAIVEIVMQESPAFRANILRGDVIIQIGDREIATVDDFSNAVGALAGRKATVKVIREGQTRDIEVQFNPEQ